MVRKLTKEGLQCILHPETLIEKAKEIGGPWIIKPVSGGSSIGILCCDDEEQLIPTALECFTFNSKLVVEHRFIDFREFNIGLLGDYDEVKLSLIEEVFKNNRSKMLPRLLLRFVNAVGSYA